MDADEAEDMRQRLRQKAELSGEDTFELSQDLLSSSQMDEALSGL